MKSSRFAVVVAATFAGSVAITDARAQDFYNGKTLTILVGFTTGGGYDTTARLLARYLGRHIPGNPFVIIRNLPGAQSLTSVLYLDKTAPKDGTVINIFDFGQIGNSRMGLTPVKVDFRNYNWLGSISQDVTACYVWHKLGIKTLADAKAHGTLHFGLTGSGTAADASGRILKNIFGLDIQPVTGYPGGTEKRLAIERGEVDGTCSSWSSTPANWIAKKEIVSLSRSSPIVPAGMPADIPYVVDIAPTPRDRAIIRLLVASSEVGRPFIASSEVPADRMKILRDAFDATMEDPDFQTAAAKEQLPVSPKNAEEALKTVNEIYATPDDIVAAARKIAAE